MLFSASSESIANTHLMGDQRQSAVTTLRDGGYVIVWSSNGQDGSSDGVFMQHYGADGARIGTERSVNTTTNSIQFMPNVIPLGDGGWVVVWGGSGTAGFASYFQRYGADGVAIGGETHVPASTGITTASAVALADGGFAFVSSNRDFVTGTESLVLARYDASGTAAAGPQTLNSFSGKFLSDVSVAELSDGTFAVAWASVDSVTFQAQQILVQRFQASGAPLGSETPLSPGSGGFQRVPTVVAAADGGFVVVWEGVNSSGQFGIHANLFDAGGLSAGGEIFVGRGFDSAAVAMPSGGFAVTFQETDADGAGIFVKIFDDAGVALTETLPVNGDTPGTQSQPAMAVTPSGDLIFAWSTESVGTGTDIAVRSIQISGGVVGTALLPGQQIASGTPGNDVFVTGSAGIEAGDVVAGGDGFDRIVLTAPGTLDLSQANISGIEALEGSSGDDTFVLSNLARSVGSIIGGGGHDTIVAKSGLDLRFNPVSGIEAVVSGSSGRIEIGVSNFTQATLVDGRSGPIGIVSSTQFSAAERTTLFANGIQYISEPGGTTFLSDRGKITVGGANPVNEVAAGNQISSAAARLADGGSVIIWLNRDSGGQQEIQGQRLAADGSMLGSTIDVGELPANAFVTPAVAALAGGGFVVTWSAPAAGSFNSTILAQRFGADGAPIGDVTMINPGGNYFQYDPHIAGLKDGSYVVVWSGTDPAGIGIHAQRFSAEGLALGAEVALGGAFSNSYDPQVVALAGGGYVVIWSEFDQDSATNGLLAQIFDPAGAAIADPLPVGTQGFDSSLPSLAAMADGGFAMAWSVTGQDGSGSSINLARYDAGGNQLTATVRVNDWIYGQQSWPSLVALADGGLAVGWMGNGLGNTFGLFVQRFDASGDAVGGAVHVSAAVSQVNSTTLLSDGEGGLTAFWPGFDSDGTGVLSSSIAFERGNHAPTGSPTGQLAGATEDVPFTFSVATLLQGFTDPDGDALTVSGLTASSGTVVINTDGTATISQAPEFSGPVTLNFSVADAFGGSVSAALGYVIAAVNDAPSGVALTNAVLSVAENNSAVRVGIIAVQDDGLGANALTLSGTDRTAFEIRTDLQTGASELWFIAAADFESKPSYAVTINVNDSSIGSAIDASTNFMLSIADAAEPRAYSGSQRGDAFTAAPQTSIDSWTINGNGGGDTLTGAAGNDILDGGAGEDVLSGGLGNDLIRGGAGKDLLIGGAGRDMFDFDSTSESGLGAKADAIFDFSAFEDRIDLSTIDANGKLVGNQAFSFIGDRAFSGVAGQLRFEIAADGNTHVLGDVNGDARPDFEIVLIGQHLLAPDVFIM